MCGSAEPSDASVATGDRGGGYLQEGRGCVAGNDAKRCSARQRTLPVLVGGLRLNRDLTWARRGALRYAGHVLLPGTTSAS